VCQRNQAAPWEGLAAPGAGQEGEAGVTESDPYAHFNASVAAITKGAYDGPMRRLGAGPERVAKAIERALRRRRPPARIVITPSAKLMLLTRSMLNDRAWDVAMRRQFPAPR